MKLKQNSPRHLVVLGLVVAGVLLGCAQSVTAQWSPIANPTPTPGTNIYYNSGNVGIGTASPGQLLHINSAAATNSAMAFSVDATSYGIWGISGSTDSLISGSVFGDSVFRSANKNFLFSTDGGSSAQLYLKNDGNVGIGTASPLASLHVFSSGVEKMRFERNGVGYGMIGITGAMSGSSADISIDGGQANTGMIFQVRNSSNSQITAMGINRDGNVGIGTTDPGYKLDVNGTINSNSTITGINIVAKYQDVAEWVPSSEQLGAGTVVVLDSTKSNQVTSSSVSYDTRVAGVVSEQPGIALGEKGDGKVLVATTGRVKVKVDASNSPIHIGDLLVTSDVPGVAMKSKAVNLGGVQFHRPGTLIGKALEPLEKGKGEILVLLSLQ